MGIYTSSSPMDEKKLSFLSFSPRVSREPFKPLGNQSKLLFFGVELGEHSLEFNPGIECLTRVLSPFG